MKGLTIIGRASEETRGAFLSDIQLDPLSKKIREVQPDGPLYRSQPNQVRPEVKVIQLN